MHRLKPRWALFLLTLLSVTTFVLGRPSEPWAGPARFVCVVLGSEGGLNESNLTSVLVKEKGRQEYVALDAGCLLSGLRAAARKGSFSDVKVPPESNSTVEGWVLQEGVKAYLISHAHLDHVAGLVINSTDDSVKPLYGLPETVDWLRDHVFNWKIWPNFGNEGDRPLNKYPYRRVAAGSTTPIAGTGFTCETFLLSHSHGYPSSAFLLRAGEDYVLYLGDTGPDEVERVDCLRRLWTRVAPLAREKKLRGIFLEASYPDGRPDEALFGHLTPAWILRELRVLAQLVDSERPQKALAGLPVVVLHIKPSLKKAPSPREQIGQQLKAQNDLRVRFVLPEQGQRLEL